MFRSNRTARIALAVVSGVALALAFPKFDFNLLAVSFGHTVCGAVGLITPFKDVADGAPLFVADTVQFVHQHLTQSRG